MKRFLTLLSILAVAIFVSCGDNTKEEIARLESQMLDSNGMLRTDVGMELIDAYMLYANKNAKSEEAPHILFKALDLSMNLRTNDYSKSIEIADLIITKYPDFEMAPMALYLKAFVYEDLMHDYSNAEKTYREFIEKYPNSPMLEEVKASLKNIGIPPQDLVRMFENAEENR